ncbi:MAG: hypothetical protein H0V50_07050 [Thermoleophilaceae bacterium]|nr:hypothetical protein [Thermoleophilaceae bacterium]
MIVVVITKVVSIRRITVLNGNILLKKRQEDLIKDRWEVQEIRQEFVVTERGRPKKPRFYLPKKLVKGYDGEKLWFNISVEEAEDIFMRERPPKEGEYSRYESASHSSSGNQNR